jgi:hypothetical protein
MRIGWLHAHLPGDNVLQGGRYASHLAILSGGVVGGQIDPVVMVNQAKANPIQPAGSAQYIPVDRRVGKEVD